MKIQNSIKHNWNKRLFNDLVRPMLDRAKKRNQLEKRSLARRQAELEELDKLVTCKKFTPKVIRRRAD